MLIAKNNLIANRVPSITNALGTTSTDDPASIIDPDFSTFYTSGRTDRLTADFGAFTGLEYVAVAGINIEGNKDWQSWVVIKDGSTDTTFHFVKRNSPVMIVFDEPRNFTNMRVVLYNNAGVNPRLTYCAAGQLLRVPNGGEQSGYNRAHYGREWKNRVTLNGQAEPIAVVRERTQLKGKLSIPNAGKEFSEHEWQDFLDFANENPFFIRESDTTLRIPATETYNPSGVNGNNAYLGYDIKATAKAHPQTRNLNNLSLDFKVYTGL